ncbi:MAG: glutamate synthase [Acutalibacteraceae bacterium]
MKIQADLMHFKALNDLVRDAEDTDIVIDNCTGQRYIASASKGQNITINGTPGNALGCYLNGSTLNVYGNTQEATGDTMNEGTIYVHGSCGDATGYGMRGGKIIIKGNSGYRTGIHMKSYKDKIPVIVIGGAAGSFLGEYQAGGVIVVLGMNTSADSIVGNFCGTGMHGGKMFLRCEENELPANLPKQVVVKKADEADLAEIDAYLDEYCEAFGEDKKAILDHSFCVLAPDTKNPYKQLYTYS